jgi:adenylate kinase
VPKGHVSTSSSTRPSTRTSATSAASRSPQRDDDRLETVNKRLKTYHEQTEPLIDYYDERGLLRRFDGSRSPTEVHDHIRATLATLRLEERL